MSMNFSDELVYSKSISAHGNYKYLRITPIGSSAQAPTLSLTSTTQTQFELPNNVINLARSKLCFDVNLPISAANSFNMLYANGLSMIDRITLTSRSGVILADIPYCGNFGALVSACNVKAKDLMIRSALPCNNVNSIQATATVQVTANNTATVNATCLTAQVSTSWTNTILPASAAAAASNAAAILASQLYPVGDLIRCNGTNNIQFGGAAFSSIAYTPFIEPLLIYSSQIANANNVRSFQIELNAFKDTLMELDKNIYFGDNLVLTINWNPAQRFAFQAVGAGQQNTITGPIDVSAAPTLANLFIYTATETDPTIISQLVSSVTNGEFSLIVPFVYCQKYSAGAAITTASMQQRINSTYGSTLLRTYFGAFNGTETNATVYNHNDSWTLNYNTYMDGLRLQDFTLAISDGTAWLANERNFRDSAMMSLQQYKDQFLHIDNWCGTSICNNDDSMLNGLSLDTDHTWMVQLNTISANVPAAGLKYYLYFTTQKKLVISKGVLTVI